MSVVGAEERRSLFSGRTKGVVGARDFVIGTAKWRM